MDSRVVNGDEEKLVEVSLSLLTSISEVNAGFFYTSAEERQALVNSERTKTDAVVMKVIELKREVRAQQ